MSVPKLKVCGMRNKANIIDVGFTDPDYMGFIFYKESPRYVGENFVIPDNLPSTIKRVGVFVNEEYETVLSRANQLHLDFIQLHGNESVDYCSRLKEKNVVIVKSFPMHDAFDFNELKNYENVVDYFLFDTKGEKFGGNSIRFNWDILTKYNQQKPFFLSGGISVDNIHDVKVLLDLNIHAVDANSKLEITPGLKSTKLILELKQKLQSL